jgi:hypothetical protein
MTMMMTDNGPMTAEQAATLMRLAREAYELDAFKPNLTRAEADRRIAMLTAKLKFLDGPPHTLTRHEPGDIHAFWSCQGDAPKPLFQFAAHMLSAGSLATQNTRNCHAGAEGKLRKVGDLNRGVGYYK